MNTVVLTNLKTIYFATDNGDSFTIDQNVTKSMGQLKQTALQYVHESSELNGFDYIGRGYLNSVALSPIYEGIDDALNIDRYDEKYVVTDYSLDNDLEIGTIVSKKSTKFGVFNEQKAT